MTALPESGKVTVEEVLECLNRYRLRATYEAAGSVIGCGARNVGRLLVEARPLSSWIVLKDTGLPSPPEYDDQPLLRHPDLLYRDHVIVSPEELLALITAYRIRSLTEGT